MSKRDKRLYIQDIVESIGKINKYTHKLTFTEFVIDPMLVDAVIRNIEIIGEAAKNIPANYKNLYKNIPWKKMINMRNKVIHEYFGVDTDILWKTIKEDLKPLRKILKEIL